MLRTTGALLLFLLLAPARLAAHGAEYVDLHQIAVEGTTYGELFGLVAPDHAVEAGGYLARRPR